MSANVSAKLITNYLQKFGWPKYQVVYDGADRAEVLTGWRSSVVDEGYVMAIRASQASASLLFVVPGLAKAVKEEIPAGQLADILMAISFANYALMLGRFCYDPRDGEIRFELAMPTDEAKVTFEQFQHCVRASVSAVDYWANRIRALCRGERSGESVYESFLHHAGGFTA